MVYASALSVVQSGGALYVELGCAPWSFSPECTEFGKGSIPLLSIAAYRAQFDNTVSMLLFLSFWHSEAVVKTMMFLFA